MFHQRLPGEKYDIAATEINAWNRVAVRDSLARRKTGNAPAVIDDDPVIIKIRNVSDYDVPRHGIMVPADGENGFVFDPVNNAKQFRSYPRVACVTPTADDRGRAVITLQPIKTGKHGRAVVAGAAVCQVDMQNESDQWADIFDDNDLPETTRNSRLKSGPAGFAQIMSVQSGTGVKWAIVRFPYRATHLPVSLTLKKLVYDTTEPFGAGVDHKFSLQHPGSCVWDDDPTTQVGDLAASGVEITDDETYDGPKLKLKKGLWEIEPQLICLGFDFAAGVSSHRTLATSVTDGHTHDYDQYWRVGYETAIARLWGRRDDTYPYQIIHGSPQTVHENEDTTLWQHVVIVGRRAIIALPVDDYEINIDLHLSNLHGDSVAVLEQDYIHSTLLLRRLDPATWSQYTPSIIWSGGPSNISYGSVGGEYPGKD